MLILYYLFGSKSSLCPYDFNNVYLLKLIKVHKKEDERYFAKFAVAIIQNEFGEVFSVLYYQHFDGEARQTRQCLCVFDDIIDVNNLLFSMNPLSPDFIEQYNCINNSRRIADEFDYVHFENFYDTPVIINDNCSFIKAINSHRVFIDFNNGVF
jgi:hypothetical protein